MRTAFAAHAVPPRPRIMASAPAVPRINSRRVRQRPDARSANQIAATMQTAPSAGPTMTRPVRNRSNSLPNQAKVTSRVPAMLPRSAQPRPKATRPNSAMPIKNTGASEVLFGAKTGGAPPMFAAAHAGVAFAGAPEARRTLARSPHVLPRHPPAALRPGVPDLRPPDLDG